ncbi:oligopeptide ABC transporter ATP-binding protein OppF [Macrococcoides caseolyticum JCSC5402]|uniref:Oligopeptide ABC transporter ATP-binding protein OppF n=2 Tax=Staphylococcaceae TaxID=90964 RepID=B9EAQ4_MACCJ|nr:oligopeptide ABC transporter ATP-binding protein OppF [Macrococcus caseolyticus JCSC5402]
MSTNRINDNTRDERIKVIDDAGNVSSTESHTDIQEKTIEHTIEDGPIEVSPEEIIEKPDQYSEEDLRKTQLTDAEKNRLNNIPYAQGKEKLIEVRNLKQYFNVGKSNEVRAIDDISFDVYKGETLGLVGESGCGKSTTGRTLIKLYNATDGKVIFDGTDIQSIKKKKELLKFNRRMQMIFQDPYASLNPRLKVMDIIAEGIDIHNLAKNKEDRANRVYELLETVGLNKEHANRYPHEFSGGQRQRIGIARALAVEPEFIIADEPISALDVSIQAQVVNLMQKLQRERGITFLFIAHDLSMVKYISDRIGVMYFGKLVEVGPANAIYNNPLHEYTKSLLSAIPLPDPESERTRIRKTYNPDIHAYTADDVLELREVAPDHYVYCSPKEYETLKNNYNYN